MIFLTKSYINELSFLSYFITHGFMSLPPSFCLLMSTFQKAVNLNISNYLMFHFVSTFSSKLEAWICVMKVLALNNVWPEECRGKCIYLYYNDFETHFLVIHELVHTYSIYSKINSICLILGWESIYIRSKKYGVLYFSGHFPEWIWAIYI